MQGVLIFLSEVWWDIGAYNIWKEEPICVMQQFSPNQLSGVNANGGGSYRFVPYTPPKTISAQERWEKEIPDQANFIDLTKGPEAALKYMTEAKKQPCPYAGPQQVNNCNII